MELLDILNKNGEKLGYEKQRGETLNDDEYVLVSHVWIQRSDGLYMVQQRSSNKKVDPLKWSTTCGFVTSGETSNQTIKRELVEELGCKISDININYYKRMFPINNNKHIADVYFIYQDIPMDDMMLQAEEVADVKFLNDEQILDEVINNNFNNFDLMYENYFEQIFRYERY